MARRRTHSAKHVRHHFPRRPGSTGAPTGGATSKDQKKRPHYLAATLGWVTFEAYTGGYRCTALLGDKTPNPTGGYAGWNKVDRQRRRGLTQWQGNDPLTIEIDIIFDGFAMDQSVEHDVRQLEKMAGLEEGMGEPPLITFDSNGVIPHDATNASQNDWVIDDIKWGDADRRWDGKRTRQAATVTVMQHIEDDSLSGASSAQRRRANANFQKAKGKAQRGAKQKKYVVKDRETLERIAAAKLGKSTRWHDLRKLNPQFRDPRKILPIGTIIKLP